MASQHTFCSLLLFAALCCISFPFAAAQCPEPGVEVFVTRPVSVTVEPNQRLTFNCTLTAAIAQEGGLPGWEFMVINDTQFRTVNPRLVSSMEKGFDLENQRQTFVIDNVQPMHSGSYRCFPVIFGCNSDSDRPTTDFVVRIIGPPIINLNNETVVVDTQSDLELMGTIAGYPSPNVEIYREIGDEFVRIDPGLNSRFDFTFDAANARLTIVIRDLLRKDMGRYKITAENDHGEVEATFIVIPNGPDPPHVTLEPGTVVSPIGQRVMAMCSVQADAFEDPQDITIQWMDRQGVRVPTTTTSPVFSRNLMNGSALLTITQLNISLVGEYTCIASNIRNINQSILHVFGPPPPPPMNPGVMRVDGDNIVISWTRPTSSDVEITSYAVDVFNAGVDTISLSRLVNASVTSYTLSISEWPMGSYEVTVSSVAGSVRGNPTGRSTFVVDASLGVTDSDDEFPLVPVAAAAAVIGAFFIVLIIGIVVGLYCYCSISVRRSKNTHQQTWGSEENKLNQQPAAPAIQNTYTALSLHDSSELPPSPLTPMASAIGIDPKWEFPREYIQLSDVLAEGQFTVLYKGVARNLKEKPCDIAVKSLKDDATEDDLKALIYEMDLLSSIEEHPNIVSLVRVCSVGKPLYMVMEYMCHGDLLGFLRSCRGHHGMYTISPGNGYQPPSLQLCSRDLLNMATKIANGMRYLADRKIVHRALCTRNVLVGSGMDVKIYNVGSFDVTLDSRDGGMVKWMAPETLYDGTNTTYSDVWSFGVALWELVTVGGTPYAEINPEDLYAQLHGGMRMPCPSHCAQEVYNIMSACWQKNPTDRPHFAVIHDNLDELVMSKMNYLDLRSYDGYAYSQFGDESAQLSTAL